MQNQQDWSTLVTRVLAPNPGPMTLEGTNSLIVRHPSSQSVVVVDPGPLDKPHLDALQEFGEIELILLTHFHADHSESALELQRLSGAPVRAFDPALSHGAPALRGGEVIEAAGCQIEVISTPGHTADSVCFRVSEDRFHDSSSHGTVLTGDTILGRGSSVIAEGGSLGEYLESLATLRDLGDLPALPGHGEALASVKNASQELLDHRESRLNQVREVLREPELAAADSAEILGAVRERIYPELEGRLRRAAEQTISAQLDYLDSLGPRD